MQVNAGEVLKTVTLQRWNKIKSQDNIYILIEETKNFVGIFHKVTNQNYWIILILWKVTLLSLETRALWG